MHARRNVQMGALAKDGPRIYGLSVSVGRFSLHRVSCRGQSAVWLCPYTCYATDAEHSQRSGRCAPLAGAPLCDTKSL